jgi:hypothetical protein
MALTSLFRVYTFLKSTAFTESKLIHSYMQSQSRAMVCYNGFLQGFHRTPCNYYYAPRWSAQCRAVWRRWWRWCCIVDTLLLLKYKRTIRAASRCGRQLFFQKGSYFRDRLNPLLLVIEPELFITLNMCGRLGGKIGEFGRNRPEKRTLVGGGCIVLHQNYKH